MCIEKGVHYTGKITKNTDRPYPLKYSNELNILYNCTEERLGIPYTTSLINFHRKTQGFDAACE